MSTVKRYKVINGEHIKKYNDKRKNGTCETCVSNECNDTAEKMGFYYCSVDCFFSIIKNKSVFLSDPLQMNDDEELHWIVYTLKKVIDKYKGASEENTEFIKELLLDSKTAIEEIKQKGQDNVFILCTSSDNGDMLSQWRGYGDDGKGLSIGFNLGKIEKRNIHLEATPVTYLGQNVTDDLMEDIVPSFIASSISKFRDDMKEEEKQKLYYGAISEASVRYKSENFSEEKEIRLIYKKDLFFPCHKFDALNFEQSIKPAYRVSDGRLIQYIELPITPYDISEIVIGPKCKLNVEDVKRFISFSFDNENCSNIVVRKSATPYR